MTERPAPAPQPDRQHQNSWNPEAIGALLSATPEPIRDGHYFIIGNGERDDLRLELYPTGHARLSTTETEILCFGLGPPTISGDQLLLRSADPETDQLQLTIAADGTVALLLRGYSSDTTERAESAGTPPIAPETHPRGNTAEFEPMSPHSDNAETSTTTTSPPGEKEQEKKDQRVELSGRIAASPRFKRSPKQGTFICEFDLMIDQEDGSQIQEKVALFGANAHQLESLVERNLLGAGDALNLVGYRRTYQQQPQIYGTHIRIAETD